MDITNTHSMAERPFLCNECGSSVSAASFRAACPDCGGPLTQQSLDAARTDVEYPESVPEA
jgi:hypothetical protein